MHDPFPPDFQRVPDEPWTKAPLEDLALGYDTVENHGWYANLDPTVAELADLMGENALLVDYSGGTGILIERLLGAVGDRPVGIVNVDSSPKFLRLSLEKLGHEPRVAFRHLRWLRDERRLQLLDECLGPPLVERGVDAIVSTNAIHLYYDLEDTLASWVRCLRADGHALVQSGNIGGEREPGTWIIDETVGALQDAAVEIVRTNDRYAAYRAALDDEARMEAYRAWSERFFLPVRPEAYYVAALETVGFSVTRVERRTVEAQVGDWFDFLRVYHEGVLPWVGGVEKLDGKAPSAQAVTHRIELMGRALQAVFEGEASFEAQWTYLTCALER